nr:hypothetical protein CFP56_61644 [Quercus suber]
MVWRRMKTSHTGEDRERPEPLLFDILISTPSSLARQRKKENLFVLCPVNKLFRSYPIPSLQQQTIRRYFLNSKAKEMKT